MADVPIKFDADGLIPAVIQDIATGAVVMTAYMDQEALRLTRETGRTHFWSRSRQTLWRKGETSGNEQIVEQLLVNCYGDSLLVRITQLGPGCHTEHATCYYRRLDADDDLRAVAARQRDVDLWYGAYEYLRDHDLGDVSTTSRLLHLSKPRLEDRLADELVELVGVLRGSHRHDGPEDDVALESSQCLYWLALTSVSRRIGVGPWLLPLARSKAASDLEPVVEALVLAAEYWGEHVDEREPTQPAELMTATAIAIADAVRISRVDIEAVLLRDLDELRAKPYLVDYFAGAEAAPIGRGAHRRDS